MNINIFKKLHLIANAGYIRTDALYKVYRWKMSNPLTLAYFALLPFSQFVRESSTAVFHLVKDVAKTFQRLVDASQKPIFDKQEEPSSPLPEIGTVYYYPYFHHGYYTVRSAVYKGQSKDKMRIDTDFYFDNSLDCTKCCRTLNEVLENDI